MDSSKGHRAPESMLDALRAADRDGRSLVTIIEGRLAILLPPSDRDAEQQADLIARVVKAIEQVEDI